ECGRNGDAGVGERRARLAPPQVPETRLHPFACVPPEAAFGYKGFPARVERDGTHRTSMAECRAEGNSGGGVKGLRAPGGAARVGRTHLVADQYDPAVGAECDTRGKSAVD